MHLACCALAVPGNVLVHFYEHTIEIDVRFPCFTETRARGQPRTMTSFSLAQTVFRDWHRSAQAVLSVPQRIDRRVMD